MFGIFGIDDDEPNEEEDENLLLHDIDEDVGEDVQIGEDFKNLTSYMEREIESMLDKLEGTVTKRNSCKKCINLTSQKAVQSLPQVAFSSTQF